MKYDLPLFIADHHFLSPSILWFYMDVKADRIASQSPIKD
jgi:hypothetical protein